MAQTVILRRAEIGDLSAVDRLLSRSYPRLLARDYAPSVMVLAVPLLCRARPELLRSGRYFLAEGRDGVLLAAGGWSVQPGRDRSAQEGGHMGSVRHVARQGVGRALMAEVMADACAEGIAWLDCLATRTAVPFYRALGFRELYPTDITLRPGIVFPAIRMMRDL
jgi:GNAT superfamily N-acetyltransferase